MTYMHVTYLKFKLGDEGVREVAVQPTYGELNNLLQEFSVEIKHVTFYSGYLW